MFIHMIFFGDSHFPVLVPMSTIHFQFSFIHTSCFLYLGSIVSITILVYHNITSSGKATCDLVPRERIARITAIRLYVWSTGGSKSPK